MGGEPEGDELLRAAEERRRRLVAESRARLESRKRLSLVEKDNGVERVVRHPRFEPDTLDRILKAFEKKNRIFSKGKLPKFSESWYTIVGPEIGGQTRPALVRGGVFTVEVYSPALRQELEGFHRESLLESLRDALPGERIREIRFRLAPRPS